MAGSCAASTTGFEPYPADAERHFSFWSVNAQAATGRIVDAKSEKVAELRGCFGPTSDRARQNFYAEIRLGALSFRGTGECLALMIDFPEPGLFPVRCQLVLSGLPAPYVGGLLTTNTLTSKAAFGGATDPAGYVQASIATIRLWKARDPEAKEAGMSDQQDKDETGIQRRRSRGDRRRDDRRAGGIGWRRAGVGAGQRQQPRPSVRGCAGVQHFGLTVQNMDRAYEFYTEVLGGTEVMRDGDFQGERIHNTLLTDQEIEARERRVNPRTMGVPDLKGGAQRLDVRFIQFDNVVIELLQYRDAEQTGQRRQLRRAAATT